MWRGPPGAELCPGFFANFSRIFRELLPLELACPQGREAARPVRIAGGVQYWQDTSRARCITGEV